MYPKVYIIVLNYNGWQDTIECLESVLRNDYPNYQVIVVDNGSPNNSMEHIKAWAEGRQEVLTPEPSHPLYHLSHPPVKKPIPYIYYTREEAEKGGDFELEEKLTKEWQKQRKSNNKENKELISTSPYPLIFIQTGENLGFAGGNNVGIRYGLKRELKWVMLLNNDTVVDHGFLQPIVKAGRIMQDVGILGPEIYSYDNFNVIQSIGAKMNLWTGRGKLIGFEEIDRGQHDQIRKVDWVSGAAIMVKRDVFVNIGLFDERFFLCYEENDLCHRARRGGFEVLAVSESKVWHKGSASMQKPIAEYYLTRNRALFMKKNAKSWQHFSFLSFYVLGTMKRMSFHALHGNKELLKATWQGFCNGIYILIGRGSATSNYSSKGVSAP